MSIFVRLYPNGSVSYGQSDHVLDILIYAIEWEFNCTLELVIQPSCGCILTMMIVSLR